MEKLISKSFITLNIIILSYVGIPFTTVAQQDVHGCVPSSVKNFNFHPIARLDSTQQLTLGVGLTLQNRDALMNLLQELYDPASPNFHQWLTPWQFTERFGPSQTDYQKVIDYVKANGFKVTQTFSDRKMVEISGSVGIVEKAFHLKMMVYNRLSEEGTFYAPDTEPTLNLKVPIADICGLQNNIIFSDFTEEKSVNSVNGGSINGLYTSQDFRAAYYPGGTLTGAGQTVGLVAVGGFDPNDIYNYETNTGLSHHTIDTVLLDGVDPTSRIKQTEVCLDIEMAIAMAPGLSRVVVYEMPADNNGSFHFRNMLYRMTQDTSIKQFSCSYGLSYPAPGPFDWIDPIADSYFLQLATQGQSFFQASGDYHAVTEATYQHAPYTYYDYFYWPSDNPYITIVGGTNLVTSGPGGYYISESVWNTPGSRYSDIKGTTGGASILYSIPQWQINANPSNSQVSTTMRNSPDAAMVAAAIYEYVGGGYLTQGGTSASAPLWAGFAALANQYAAINGRNSIGFINPTVYAIGKTSYIGSAFHDVTVGDNTWTWHDPVWYMSDPYFTAASGYDLCAGWGSPNGQTLVNLLSAIVWSGTTTISSSFTVPSGQTLIIVPGTTVQFANGVSLIVYGRLNATGVTFTRSGSSGNWGSIVFSGSGAGGSSLSSCTIQYGTEIDVLNGANNVTITDCNITNNSSHGINVSGSSYFTATSNTIANGNVYHGIALSGGNGHICFGNTIYKNQGTSGYHNGAGICFSSSSIGSISRNDVEHYNWGIAAMYGAYVNSSWSYGSDHNNRAYDNLSGIKVYASSWCDLGRRVGGVDNGNGNNSIRDNTYNVVLGNSSSDYSTLYAEDNWWGAYPPQTSKFSIQSNCTFSYNYYRSTDPWLPYPLHKVSGAGQIAGGIETNSATSNNQIQEVAVTDDLQDSLLIGEKFKGKNKDAVTYLKSYISNHPDNDAGYVVMYGFADSSTIPEIIDFFKSSNPKTTKIHKLLLGHLYQMEGKPDLAEKANNDFIAENPNTTLAVAAAINNMRIDLYTNNNVEAAKAILEQVEKQADLIDPMELTDARQMIVTYVDPKTGMMPNMRESNETTANNGLQNGLMSNYPNPFNPSTKISYTLSTAGHITLKIFDVLGREVATLVNEVRSEGKHEAIFNASALASGVYFCRMEISPIEGGRANRGVKTMKMLVTK